MNDSTQKTRSTPSQWRRRIQRIGRSVVVGGAIAFGIVLLCVGYLWFSTPLPDTNHLRARAAIGNTRIYDRNGRVLLTISDPFGASRRPVSSDAIPSALRSATIAVEDAGFYDHAGVDIRGILRALVQNVRAGEIVAGGSTITQQLARSFLLEPGIANEQTLERKLREAVLALKLTAAYPRDEILTMYLNQVYYGGNAYGVEAASRRIFGRSVSELRLSEAALLAGLPQAPSKYDPLIHPDAAIKRRAVVLAAMARSGFISEDEAALAGAEPFLPTPTSSTLEARHFVDYVVHNLTATIGAEALTRGGLTITTTIDVDLQRSAEASLRRRLAQLAAPTDGSPDHRARNGAVVVIDPADGAILAMVGSPDFNDQRIQGQFNAAIAERQPGSALKPFTYAAALERGYTTASTILDIPTSFTTRDGSPYTPFNYDRTFHGPLSLRQALATSSNVGAVRVLDSIGVPTLLDILGRSGITTLAQDPSRFGLALTLGGGEVTLLQLSAAYGVFATGGLRVEPYAIQSATDAEGHSVLAQPISAPPPRVIEPTTAFLISDVLSDRFARMRAFGANSVLDIDRPAAVKTGTTTDWRDNWAIGYTPDRIVGVWVGNADDRSMEAISGIDGAGPIWQDVMRAAHRGIAVHSFVKPAGILQRTICTEGGALPSPNCPGTREEYFTAGTAPSAVDTSHVRVFIDPALGCLAPPGYPAQRTVARVYRLLPAEAQPWARDNAIPQIPRIRCELPHNGTSTPPSTSLSETPLTRADEPFIIAPANGAIFVINAGVPRAEQQLEIKARYGDGTAALTILVDGTPLANVAAAPYRVFWTLQPGRHRIVASIRTADGHTRFSTAVEIIVRVSTR